MIKRFMKRKPDDPGDSGSLNDLSFLLIVFFIVIAGFNVNKGFLVNLPEKNKPRVVQTNDLIRCELGPTGEITIDGKVTSLEAASTTIGAMAKSKPNMTLLLVIDPETRYQRVIDVIHEIRTHDIENFSFRMKEDGK